MGVNGRHRLANPDPLLEHSMNSQALIGVLNMACLLVGPMRYRLATSRAGTAWKAIIATASFFS